MKRKSKIIKKFKKGATTLSFSCVNAGGINIKCKVSNGIIITYVPKFINGKPVTDRRRKYICSEIHYKLGRYNESC